MKIFCEFVLTEMKKATPRKDFVGEDEKFIYRKAVEQAR